MEIVETNVQKTKASKRVSVGVTITDSVSPFRSCMVLPINIDVVLGKVSYETNTNTHGVNGQMLARLSVFCTTAVICSLPAYFYHRVTLSKKTVSSLKVNDNSTYWRWISIF